MKLKFWAVNAIVAAVYVVLTLISAPLAYGLAQFRISEMMNHLIVFSKKYFFGIVCGVLIANLFSPNGAIDLLFGPIQSAIALGVTILGSRYTRSVPGRMALNTGAFTVSMALIAWELVIIGVPVPFLIVWLYVAAGEFVVLLIGAPIFYLLNKRLNFGGQF